MTARNASAEEGPLDRSQLQSRAASGAMWTLVHVLVSLPLAFAVNIVLARVLGVADYGRLAYLTMVMEIAGVIVTIGVAAGLTQFGAKAHAKGDYNGVRALLSQSQGFRLLVGSPILTFIVVFLADVPLALLLTALLFGIWIPAGFGGALSALTIQNDTARSARLAMVMNFVTQAVVLLTVFTISTADSVWSARMVVTGLGVIVAILLVDPRYRLAVLRPRLPREMPKGFWRFAVPMGLSGVVATLALGRSEVVLLQHLSTAEQVGLYAMAFGLAGHLFAPAQALLNPLTPAISALREVDTASVGDAFKRTIRISSTLAAGILGAGAPVLAILTPLLYGQQFKDAGPLVLWLTLASGLLIVTFPMQTYVSARLRGGSVLATNLVALAISIAIALAAIPFVGAWGAVAGKLSVAVARFIWLAWTETDSFSVKRRTVFRVTAPVLLGAAACLIGYYSIVNVDLPTLVGAALAGLIGGTTLVILLRVTRTGISKGDALAIVRQVPRRLERVTQRLLAPAVSEVR